METVKISAAKIQELVQNPGLAFITGFDGRWKCSTWLTYKNRQYQAAKLLNMATTYSIYFDDASRKPWSFNLFDDDGNVLFKSKSYKTKAAAASVAARKLNERDTSTKLLSNKILTEKPPKEQTRTPIAQYYITKMERAKKMPNV